MIVIGRLHAGPVLPEWLAAWEALEKPVAPDGRADWMTYSAVRQVVHLARNDIARKTLAEWPDATHLFYLDDDVCVPPGGLLRLLRDSAAHDLPIVSGLYVMRAAPLLPVAYRTLDVGGVPHHVNLTAFCDGLQEVDAVGAGCLLIRTDVLRAFAERGWAWFDYDVPGLPATSEDLAFCARARSLGYRVALDADVKCTHLGVLEVTYDYFQERLRQGVTYASPAIEAASRDVRPWAPAVRAEAAP